jgi:modified peptide precursor CbpA
MWVFHFWGKNTPSKRQKNCGIRTHLPACAGVSPSLHRTRGAGRHSDSNCATKGGDSVKTTKKSDAKRPIIATRKGCNANGTGLSHYVMMDSKK